MKANGNFSFGELVHSIQYELDLIDTEQLNIFFKNYGNLIATGSLLAPTTYILDYTSKKYVAMDNNVEELTGYPTQNFLDGGLDFLLKITDRADLAICTDQIFKYNLSFLNNLPTHEHGQYLFSHNYRVNSNNNGKIMLYQQNNLIVSPKSGLPAYSIGLISDIGHLKTDNSILHQIGRMGPNKNFSKDKIIYSKTYYPETQLLSKRESQVVKLLAEGMSSRQIAETLFISESTVTIHRKNMLEKSNCKNVAQLIAFSARNHII